MLWSIDGWHRLDRTTLAHHNKQQFLLSSNNYPGCTTWRRFDRSPCLQMKGQKTRRIWGGKVRRGMMSPPRCTPKKVQPCRTHTSVRLANWPCHSMYGRVLDLSPINPNPCGMIFLCICYICTQPYRPTGDNNNNVIMNWLFVHLLSYDRDNVLLIDLSRFCSILFLSFFGFATSGSLSNFIMNGWTWSKQTSSSVQSILMSLKLIINKT